MKSNRQAADDALRALAGVALVASLFYVIHVGRPVLLPLALAAVIAILLLPLAGRLEKLGLPRAVAALFLVAAFLAGTAALVAILREPAMEWMERAPRSIEGLRDELAEIRSPVEQVARAADQVEEMTAPSQEGSRSEVRVSDGPSLSDTIIGGTWRAITLMGLVTILVLFFLVYRSVLLAKVVALMPDADGRRRALAAADAIQGRLGHFLVWKAVINAVLGAAVAGALWALGYSNPILWGAMAAILNIVPYLGALVGIAIVLVVGLLTLDGVQVALLGAGSYAFLTSIEGVLLTPSLLGTRLSLDPIAILSGVLLAGLVWGPAGVLLAVPILVCVKVVAEYHPEGRIVALVLGRGDTAVRLLRWTRLRSKRRS